MCRPDSFSDQRQKVGLPLHSAPRLLLEASVVTTFFMCDVSKVMPCFSQKRSVIHRPESPLSDGIRDAKPRMEPSALARTG